MDRPRGPGRTRLSRTLTCLRRDPMRSVFQTMADRLRALFVADLALEFEAQLLARQADRRAKLLVQAEQHDQHGFPSVAAQLGRQAEALSPARPLAAIRPALEPWRPDEPAPA